MMLRLVLTIAAAAMLLTGCKGKKNPNPPIIAMTVTVKVTQAGQPVANVPVVESSGYDIVNKVPTGVVTTQTTLTDGSTVFTIGNPTVQYCFSATYMSAGNTINLQQCNPTVTAGTTYHLGT
ncbi:MAG: hypothetical protein M3Y21_04815 [Candidatus Eremiobacteraeota bacterium]|nr:hypothetical protein [Candidatus Eremiobacteraeota bacterium]